MTSLWHSDGTRWRLLEPAGFPAEQELHDLIGQAPQLLPLAGQPTIAILGSEVALGTNSADLIGIEPSGRLVIIEVKLRKNQEARRAVVAQALSYAAYLQGLDLGELEGRILAAHLGRAGFGSVDQAMQNALQGEQLDVPAFRAAIDENLGTGAFRLVFVLDDAPAELARLVEYLELVSTDRLLIDLISVAQYQVGSDKVVVPTRVEAERREPPRATGTRPPRPAESREVAGIDEFVRSIELAPTGRDLLRQLTDWATELESAGVARLATTVGVGRWALRVLVRGRDAGLVTIWNAKGPDLCLWRTVFEKVAPASITAVEDAIGTPLGVGRAVPHERIDDSLLRLLRSAYEEAHAARVSP